MLDALIDVNVNSILPNFQASQQVAKHLYDIKVQPSTLLPKQIGNMYTASLYAALASVIYNKHDSLVSLMYLLFMARLIIFDHSS